jgi:hypothetical protein
MSQTTPPVRRFTGSSSAASMASRSMSLTGYINDEIIPACVEDWNGDADIAAEAKADSRREMHQHLAMKVAA